MKMPSFPTLAAIALVCAGTSAKAIVVHTSDFIADGSRSHFNGFESIPNDGTFFTGGGGPYTEDTIQVQQINGDAGNDIWVTSSFWSGFQGSYGWYPNGGDSGYTTLSLVGGLDFDSVGFNYGTGDGTPQFVLYDLLDNGVVVLSGSALLTSSVNYLGFSGGGFDTIRMRDTTTGAGGFVTDGSFQALTLDNIETFGAVPEPSTYCAGALLVLVFGVQGVRSLRNRKQTA